MAFDEHLRRVFEAALAELTQAARAEAEHAREEGLAQGRTEGVEHGRSEGIQEGHSQGLVAGRAHGMEEGRAKGLAEGRAQGAAEGRSQGLEEGRATGFEEGRAKGYDEGRAKGLEEGRAKGLEEGRAQGWEDGREQGLYEGQEEARAQLLAEAETRAADSTVLDRLLDGLRAIDRARSLSEVLDTAAACAGREGARAAVLLARGSQLRGWRFIGFDQSFHADSFDVALHDGGVIANACETRAFATSDDVPAFAQPGQGRAVACPLEVAGEVVAVLYADGVSVDAPFEMIGRHAGRVLEAMTAIKAARTLVQPSDPNAPSDGNHGADDADASARRYAKLLVSEIKLYHEPAVIAGRRDRDLATRLGGEIARARVLYEQRVPTAVRQRRDYFRDELVRTLANGDATLLQLN